MRWLRMNRTLVVVGSLVAAATPLAAVKSQMPAWTSLVDTILGRAGAMQPGGVYKFSLPRSDLKVAIADVQLKPALALGSWIGFLPVGNADALVMGDLVLTEAEIGPVMKSLQEGGVEQTALHNHLRGESPHIMYMHFMASGKPETIARAIHAALALTGTPSAVAPGSPPASPVELDTAAIARILRQSGKLSGVVYQVTIPRSETIRMKGQVIPPSMGVATAINFQPTGGGRAVATGDFVLVGSEVNPVIRALRSHDIDVTAVHSHMLEESPRLFFMHFWGNGDAASIARGLRSALDVTNRSR
jgi:Domain of Unknown Function (DUF1259)